MRGKILSYLILEKYGPEPPVSTGGSGVGTSVRDTWAWKNLPPTPQAPPFTRPVEDDETPPFSLEQPFVTVTVHLLDVTGTEQIEAQQQLDFVTVLDLKVDGTAIPTIEPVNSIKI